MDKNTTHFLRIGMASHYADIGMSDSKIKTARSMEIRCF